MSQVKPKTVASEDTFGPGRGDADLGRRIGVIAQALGTARAADIAGVSKKQLGRWIAGESSPPALALARLVLASGYEASWLLTGHGRERAESPTKPKAETLSSTIEEAMSGLKAVRRVVERHRRVAALIESRLRALGFSADSSTTASTELAAVVLADPRAESDEDLAEAAAEAVRTLRPKK